MMWMPLRSAKMKRRIFGIPTTGLVSEVDTGCEQLLRGWLAVSHVQPQWLSLPSSSDRFSAPDRLRELEMTASNACRTGTASARTTRLLALDRSRIARQEAEIAQLAAMRLVDLHERARDGEAKRAGLTGRVRHLRRSPSRRSGRAYRSS